MTQNGPRTTLNCPQTSATSEVPCRPRCPQNTLDFHALPRFGSHRCMTIPFRWYMRSFSMNTKIRISTNPHIRIIRISKCGYVDPMSE
eukprot:gene7474-47_t